MRVMDLNTSRQHSPGNNVQVQENMKPQQFHSLELSNPNVITKLIVNNKLDNKSRIPVRASSARSGGVALIRDSKGGQNLGAPAQPGRIHNEDP